LSLIANPRTEKEGFMKGQRIGIILLLASILALGLSPGVRATTECDTDPQAIPYQPTVDPSLLNAVLNLLGEIDVDYTFSPGISLLYDHTLNLTVNSPINLEGVDFLVTTGVGSIEVELDLPAWAADMSIAIDHAPCRDCGAEHSSCMAGCDADYDACCTYPLCELICGPIWTACQAGCLTLRGLCEADVLLCQGEAAGIDLLLDGATAGVGFDSATITQTADVCVNGSCEAIHPVESTDANIVGFHLQLLPEGDPLGIGAWLNDIISDLLDWFGAIDALMRDFFDGGALISPFASDIKKDGCIPVQEVIDCNTAGCSTVDEPRELMGRRASVVFYAVPVAVLFGLILWRRRGR
jgi:hypothetical protein